MTRKRIKRKGQRGNLRGHVLGSSLSVTTTLEHEEAQRQNTREQQNSYFTQNKGIYCVVLILAEVNEAADC